jgi:hypothetical protein
MGRNTQRKAARAAATAAAAATSSAAAPSTVPSNATFLDAEQAAADNFEVLHRISVLRREAKKQAAHRDAIGNTAAIAGIAGKHSAQVDRSWSRLLDVRRLVSQNFRGVGSHDANDGDGAAARGSARLQIGTTPSRRLSLQQSTTATATRPDADDELRRRSGTAAFSPRQRDYVPACQQSESRLREVRRLADQIASTGTGSASPRGLVGQTAKLGKHFRLY